VGDLVDIGKGLRSPTRKVFSHVTTEACMKSPNSTPHTARARAPRFA